MPSVPGPLVVVHAARLFGARQVKATVGCRAPRPAMPRHGRRPPSVTCLSACLPRRPLVWRMTGKECGPASKAVRAVRFEARERRACARGGDRFGCSQSVADPPNYPRKWTLQYRQASGVRRHQGNATNQSVPSPCRVPSFHAAPQLCDCERASARGGKETRASERWPRPSCTNTGPEHAPCVRCPVGRTDGRTDVRGQWLG